MSDDTPKLTHRPTEMRSLLSVGKWFGVGALVHAALIGPAFNASSLWSWGYLAAWPIPLAWFLLTWLGAVIWFVLVVVFWIALCVCIAWGLYELWQWARITSRQATERYDRATLDANQAAAARDKELG